MHPLSGSPDRAVVSRPPVDGELRSLHAHFAQAEGYGARVGDLLPVHVGLSTNVGPAVHEWGHE